MPLTEPPVRRYFRKLRRFSPSTEQTTFFAHRYGIFTAVRSLKPTLTKNLLSAVFLIASVPHCRRFWQVFCACFCAFCRATTKGGGKLTTFSKALIANVANAICPFANVTHSNRSEFFPLFPSPECEWHCHCVRKKMPCTFCEKFRRKRQRQVCCCKF